MLSPCLAIGGVERWLATVARLSFHIDWVGLAMHGKKQSIVDARSYRELTTLMPVTFDRQYILDRSEVLLIWSEGASPDLRDWPGKLVHVIHGESAWSRQMAAANAKRLDHVIAVSQAAAAVAPPGVPLTIVDNVLDGNRLRPSASRNELRSRYDLGARLAVCYVGRFVDDKDPLVAARAAAELGGVAVYCAVGPGSWRQQVTAICPNAVFVEPTQAADAFAMSDCFAMGSREEGFGYVYLEALALGCPIVARRAGILRTWPGGNAPAAFTDLDQFATPGQAVRAALAQHREHGEALYEMVHRDFVRSHPGDLSDTLERVLLSVAGKPAPPDHARDHA